MTSNMAAERKLHRMQELFTKNLDFFKKHATPIYKQITECKEKPELSLDPSNSQLMLCRQGKPLYPDNPIECARLEVEEFTSIISNKIYLPKPSGLRLTHLIKENAFQSCVLKYQDACNQLDTLNIKPATLDVFVFGIGFGYHIEMLVNTIKFQTLTIIERDVANLIASMQTIDWTKVMSSLPDKSSITFQIRPSGEEEALPKAYLDGLRNHCHRLYPSIGISSIIYNHRPFSDEYSKEKSIINEYNSHVKVSSEMIGPEAQRLFNALENIKKGFKKIDFNKTKLKTKKLVSIIGAGPSLDIYSKMLTEHRDKLYLISAGSGLSSLLKMNLKPDLHFELEFQNIAGELIEFVNSEHDISDLHLASTFEVNPRIPNFFKSVKMFIPETSELTLTFDDENILRKGGVTCTNGAVSFASTITDQNLFLFGLDFAYTNNQHHSKNNISSRTDTNKELIRLKMIADSRKAELPVKGNITETVLTSVGLNSARMAMEALLETRSNKVFNCSHGAEIKGTDYLSIAELESMIHEISEDSSETESIVTADINQEKLLERANAVLRESLRYSEDTLEKIKGLKGSANENTLFLRNHLHATNRIYFKDLGQTRNIMGIIKFPILLLYTMLLFVPDEKQSEIIEAWAKDFKAFIEFLEDLFITALETNNFKVKNDWMK